MYREEFPEGLSNALDALYATLPLHLCVMESFKFFPTDMSIH